MVFRESLLSSEFILQILVPECTTVIYSDMTIWNTNLEGHKTVYSNVFAFV